MGNSPCRAGNPPAATGNKAGMRYFIRDSTLASLAADGTISRYTESGWAPATLTAQALTGPGWRQISASEAVAWHTAKEHRP